MRHTCQVRRTWKEDPEGQRRWDRAYQLLLQRTRAAPKPQEELDDASSLLRARVDRSATARTDD
jgi:hypothetical protein